jgi:hypothetical protein
VGSVHQRDQQQADADRIHHEPEAQQAVRDFFGVDATFYVEAFNIFNFKRYSYDAVFRSSTLTSGGTLISRNIEKYETNPESLRFYDDFAPFLVDQTFMIYDNEPRSVYLGCILNF